MNRNRTSLLMLIASAIAVPALYASGLVAEQGAGAASRTEFLIIGDYYIKTQSIDYVVSGVDSMTVAFQGRGQLELRGVDALAFRAWLAAQHISRPPASLAPGSLPNPTSNAYQGQQDSGPSTFYGNEGFRNYEKRKEAERLKEQHNKSEAKSGPSSDPIARP